MHCHDIREKEKEKKSATHTNNLSKNIFKGKAGMSTVQLVETLALCLQNSAKLAPVETLALC